MAAAIVWKICRRSLKTTLSLPRFWTRKPKSAAYLRYPCTSNARGLAWFGDKLTNAHNRNIFGTRSNREFSSASCRQANGHENPNGDREKRKPIKLMEFREHIWPHPLKSLRNKFFGLLIRSYFDEHYSANSFLDGVEQAIGHVSSLISQGNFAALEGLVTKEAVAEIQTNYNSLNVKERKWLAVNPKDMFLRFIYEIGMIFDDNTDQRFVEITAVVSGCHGLHARRESDPDNYTQLMVNEPHNVYVCNYRLIREYTKGKEDDWIINKLNHFCPQELVKNTNLFQR